MALKAALQWPLTVHSHTQQLAAAAMPGAVRPTEREVKWSWLADINTRYGTWGLQGPWTQHAVYHRSSPFRVVFCPVLNPAAAIKGSKSFKGLRRRIAWGEMTLLKLAAPSPTAGWMILNKPRSRTLMSAQTKGDSVRNVSVMKPNHLLKVMKFIWYWHCCLFCESLRNVSVWKSLI